MALSSVATTMAGVPLKLLAMVFPDGVTFAGGHINVGSDGAEKGVISNPLQVALPSGAQAVSVASLPLPTGAADAATLAAVSAKLDTLIAAERPYQGAVPMAVGTAQPAQRAVRISCTTAGNVSLTYVDGSTDVIPVNVGLSYIAGAITTVNSSGTTATATYANMK